MFIDIHTHTRRVPGMPRRGKQAYATPAELIERQDELDIERAVLLPGISPECSYGPQSLEEILDICREYPSRFIPFCNIDPRMLTNSPDAPLDEIIGFYKDKGCKGVGELCANLRFDDPMVKNLFRHCERLRMPVTFHMSSSLGGDYGLFDEPGLLLLEGALKEFPELVFLGHSQAFWAEIGPLEDVSKRGSYPEGPVAAGGRVVELMRRYPNLHGDLSANSGYNAVSRDEEFGVRFLEEFQDRLCFGTDICAPDTPAPLAGYLLKLRDEDKISGEAFDKIARLNAIRLLGLS